MIMLPWSHCYKYCINFHINECALVREVDTLAFVLKLCADIVVEVFFVSEGAGKDVSNSLEYDKWACVRGVDCLVFLVKNMNYTGDFFYVLNFEVVSSVVPEKVGINDCKRVKGAGTEMFFLQNSITPGLVTNLLYLNVQSLL